MNLESGQGRSLWHPSREGRRQRLGLADRDESAGPSPALLIAGVVAVGLCAWALYTFGPELRRYAKIKNM